MSVAEEPPSSLLSISLWWSIRNKDPVISKVIDDLCEYVAIGLGGLLLSILLLVLLYDYIRLNDPLIFIAVFPLLFTALGFGFAWHQWHQWRDWLVPLATGKLTLDELPPCQDVSAALQEAAVSGDISAQSQLGESYRGVAAREHNNHFRRLQLFHAAEIWLARATEAGDASAKENLEKHLQICEAHWDSTTRDWLLNYVRGVPPPTFTEWLVTQITRELRRLVYKIVSVAAAISRRHHPVRSPQRKLRSYFEHGPFLRFFLACKDRDVDRSFEHWANTALPSLALTALNVEETDLTRENDYVWGLPQNDPTIEIKDRAGKITKSWPYKERLGRDQIWRSNVRLFAIILYAKDQLMCCTVLYNVIGDVHTRPNTFEYFYRNIVSVETSENVFVLTSSGGTKISVPLIIEQRQQIGDVDRADRAVRNVRTMLREKNRNV